MHLAGRVVTVFRFAARLVARSASSPNASRSGCPGDQAYVDLQRLASRVDRFLARMEDSNVPHARAYFFFRVRGFE